MPKARPREKNFDTPIYKPLVPGPKYDRSLPERLQDPAFLAKIETLAGYGMSEPEICHVLDMNLSTYRLCKEKDAALLDIAEKGRAKAASQVAGALFKRCLEGDINAIKWFENTRCKRSEMMSVGVVHADIESLDPEMRRRRLFELQEKMGLLPRAHG
jgi:hypothetical protein